MREIHNEGYINQYTLDSSSVDKNQYVFISENLENSPEGMKARVILTIENENEFIEIFELAFPGKEYEEFLKNHWTRK